MEVVKLSMNKKQPQGLGVRQEDRFRDDRDGRDSSQNYYREERDAYQGHDGRPRRDFLEGGSRDLRQQREFYEDGDRDHDQRQNRQQFRDPRDFQGCKRAGDQ